MTARMSRHAALPDAARIAAARALAPGAFAAPLPERLRRAAPLLLAGLVFLWCVWSFGVTPARVWTGLERLGGVLAFMFPPHLWTTWAEWREVLKGLGETLAIAFLGTLLGALAAFPLGFLGARTVNRWPLLRVPMRRGFDILRAVETLILALVFIRAFGLGPLAGIMAIAVSEIGVFAKLFAEAIENASEKPVEGVKSAGASRLGTLRIAVLPQVMPVILSIILYNFESNVRSGTILGIVGAGGIGFLLSDRIAAYNWPEAWTIIFLIIAMVYAIDTLSARLRAAIIGGFGR